MRLFKSNIQKMAAKKDIHGLSKVLMDKDVELRKNAVEALAQIGGLDVVTPLRSVCSDNVWQIRYTAMTALVNIDETSADKVLAQALIDENPTINQFGIDTLQKMGVAALEPINIALKNAGTWQRKKMVYKLQHIGTTSVIKPLSSLLCDVEFEVRSSAKNALQELGFAPDVEPMFEALTSPKEKVRDCANDTLRFLTSLNSVEPLIKALKSPNFKVQEWAFIFLGRFKEKQAVEPLIALLKDESEGTVGLRKVAVECLGNIGDKQAVEPLLAQLATGAKAEAAIALGKIGDQRAVEPLLMALDDSDSFISLCAAQALTQFKETRAVEPLINMLHDANEYIRLEAVKVLAQIKDPRAVKPLITLLADPDYRVRNDAAFALGQIGDPQAVESLVVNVQAGDFLHADVGLTGGLLDGLYLLDKDRHFEVLTDALANHEDWGVRWHAASVLRRWHKSLAIDPLISALKDPDPQVRISVIKALELIGDEIRTLPELRRVAREDKEKVAKVAREAIKFIRERTKK